MSELTQLRKVQLAELDILKEVIKICDKYSLRYFMIGGTMLGAVRHKGFIPWDDDIDIALPRRDYERFLQVADKELPHPYKLLNRYGKHPCLYAKVHNVDTTLIESNVLGYPEYYKGIFIDVMALDGMPENVKKRDKYCKKIGNMVKAFNWHRYDFRHCKSLLAKLCYLIPEKWIYNRWKKLSSEYDYDESKYTCFAWLHNPKRYEFETKYFNITKNYLFEGIEVKGPEDYDKYLTAQFRNYMELPPESQRINHSGEGIINLDKSFEEYRAEESK